MAGAAVEFRDIDSIIDRWKMDETPYYSLWQGNQLKFINEVDDESEAEDKLKKALEQIEASQTTAIYSLRTHRDNKNFSNKKEYKGSFTFRLTDYDVIRPGNNRTENGIIVLDRGGKGSQPVAPPTGLESKLDQLIQLNMQILQRQQEEEDEEEEEEDELTEEQIQAEQQQKLQNTLQMVGAIADVAKPIIMQLFDLFKGNNATQNTFMAGTQQTTGTPQERLDAACAILIQVLGEDTYVASMEKLAKMAQENPNKLKGALSFL